MKAATGPAGNQTQPETRLYFADKLKVALTMLVIAHHAGQPYGPTGGAWPISSAQHSAWLGPFFAVNAAFFMGLFFLVSGSFVPLSYDRKGAAGFLGSRLTRLGIPVAVYALFLTGPIAFLALAYPDSVFGSLILEPARHLDPSNSSVLAAWLGYLYDHAWTPLYNHLWFLLNLLWYGGVYVLWRAYRPAGPESTGRTGGHPTHRQIVIYLLALAGVTWLVRIWYPVDHWVALFFLIPAEIAHLPQYFSLFMIGVLASRRDWLRRTPDRLGIIWLRIGLIAGALLYAYWLVGLNFLPLIIARGGPGWQSAVWCLWEAVICTGLCVGLPVWFRKHLSARPGGLARALISAAYGAYIIHFLLVIALQFALQSAPLPPLVKFALVTVAGIAVSFALSHALRLIPGVKRVL